MAPAANKGIIDKPSNHSVDETVERLTGILQAKQVALFALVDHSGEAEKAGLKAGDVIISLNGEHIRSVGDLREKLASRDSDKPASVKLGVLRNKSEMSVIVDLPAAPPRAKHIKLHQTNI